MAAPGGTTAVFPTGSWLFAADITPSDSATFPGATRGIMVTVAGNVNVRMVGDGSTIILPLLASYPYPISCDRILATNTTASGIKAFW